MRAHESAPAVAGPVQPVAGRDRRDSHSRAIAARRGGVPMMNRLTLGLTPPQIAAVLGVFVLTLFGAMALAFAFRWWNNRALA